MKLRTILLTAGASLLLGVSLPSGFALAEGAPTAAMPGQPAAATPMAPRTGQAEGVTIPMQEPMAMRVAEPEGAVAPGKVPCPHPFSQTVNATGTPQGGSNFPSAYTNLASGLNDPRSNRIFEYVFHVKLSPELCCEITSAVLTMKLKCHADIPENDSWSLWRNQHGIASGAIGWPQSCNGQTKTVTYTATPGVLADLNSDDTMSLMVQDDTTVVSASLAVSGCCVLRGRH